MEERGREGGGSAKTTNEGAERPQWVEGGARGWGTEVGGMAQGQEHHGEELTRGGKKIGREGHWGKRIIRISI